MAMVVGIGWNELAVAPSEKKKKKTGKPENKPEDDEEVNQCVAGVLGNKFHMVVMRYSNIRSSSLNIHIYDYLSLFPQKSSKKIYPHPKKNTPLKKFHFVCPP